MKRADTKALCEQVALGYAEAMLLDALAHDDELRAAFNAVVARMSKLLAKHLKDCEKALR